jgi:hypothetical protein
MAEAVGFKLGVIGAYDTCLAAYHLISGIAALSTTKVYSQSPHASLVSSEANSGTGV